MVLLSSLLFRYVNIKIWSQVGHFTKSLSKGSVSTTWIWNLHSEAHDYDQQQSTPAIISRKIFASNLAHISLVCLWIGGMHFHGAYYSNYESWLRDPKHTVPSAHRVYSLVGQDILNSDVGGNYQGIYITSGLYQLWRSEGIVNCVQLKYAACASLICAILSAVGSYIHMHIVWTTNYKQFKKISVHHLIVLLGLGSISWSGHQIHIALPINRLLDCGVDPFLMPSPQDILLSGQLSYETITPGMGVGPVNLSLFLPKGVSLLGSAGKLLNPSTGSVFLAQIAAHHLFVGIVCIIAGLIVLRSRPSHKSSAAFSSLSSSWHSQVSINLAITGSLSISFAHAIYAMPVYPYCATDYPTELCLFTHHIWLGGLLTMGAGSHASIFMIRDVYYHTFSTVSTCNSYFLQELMNHRDVILSHIIWVTVALGLHSFGLYIHNDTLQALGRPEDMFSDNAIQLKPIFALWLQTIVSFDIEVLDGKIVRMTQELGTADYMVHHIHAFTIHTTVLILCKGVLYARSSRLVSDKLELGFRYPCDGPGRGGTCQISPWDHIYLSIFWMYNSLSVVLFHFFWKQQSDVWGSYELSSEKVMHMTAGDFSINSHTINGWLRNYLWSQAAQVIQSYGTSLSGFGLIFLGAHFVWAFSLMFLFSGRGYWQELIESILWSHNKLRFAPHIQPRALSITQGRSVGLTHYLLGGIGCTWSFFLCRILS